MWSRGPPGEGARAPDEMAAKWLSVVPGKSTGVVLWDGVTPIVSANFRPYPTHHWREAGNENDPFSWKLEVDGAEVIHDDLQVVWKPLLSHRPSMCLASEWEPAPPRKKDNRIVRSSAEYMAFRAEVLGVVTGVVSPVRVSRVPASRWGKWARIVTGIKKPGTGTPAEREYWFDVARNLRGGWAPDKWTDAQALVLGEWAIAMRFAPPYED